MATRSSTQVTKVWRVEERDREIAYVAAVLDDIRIAAIEGLTRLSHGGIEIGGVLFGTCEGEVVRILAHRPVPCEYASGPSYVLSPADEAVLEEMLAQASGDRELEGMVPVGFYHSHTRSGILLTEKDAELFDRHFPEAWQVALVVRPYQFEPSRGGFFFREADGAMRTAASYREFDLPHPVKEPAPAPEPEAWSQTPPMADAAPVAMPRQVVPRTSPATIVLRARHPRRLGVMWIATGAVATVCAAGAIVAPRLLSPRPVALRVTDSGGQLHIEWNRSAQLVQRAGGGALVIDDGGRIVRAQLDSDQVHMGNVTYVRHAGNVLVRLVLKQPGGAQAEEVAHFLGPDVQTAEVSSPAAPEVPTVFTAPPPDTAPSPPPVREQAARAGTVREFGEEDPPAGVRETRRFEMASLALPRSRAGVEKALPPPPAILRVRTNRVRTGSGRARGRSVSLAPIAGAALQRPEIGGHHLDRHTSQTRCDRD